MHTDRSASFLTWEWRGALAPTFQAVPLLLRRRFALFTDEETAVAEGQALWAAGWRGVKVAWPDGAEVHVTGGPLVTYSPVLFVFADSWQQHQQATVIIADFPGYRAQCWGCHSFTFSALEDARLAERALGGSVQLGGTRYSVYMSRA